LERGLDSATKMLERLREQTAGAELSRDQKFEYEKADMNRVIQRYQESEAQRSAAERAAAENEAKEVNKPDGNPKSAKEMENEDRAGTIKAISSISPSPGMPGEGGSVGFAISDLKFQIEDPHPNPPPEYRERE
jgi:hypothetical protein